MSALEDFMVACDQASRCIDAGKPNAARKYQARAERLYKSQSEYRRELMQAIPGGTWAPPFHVWDIALEEQQEALSFSAAKHGNRSLFEGVA